MEANEKGERPSRRCKELALQNMSSKKKSNLNDTSNDTKEPSLERSDGGSDLDNEAKKSAIKSKRAQPGEGGGKKSRGNVSRNEGTTLHRSQISENENIENSIYEMVKNGMSLTRIVDDWIESYKTDRDSALVSLNQFFIHASGCRGRFTLDMFKSMEHTEIIRRMTEEFDEDSSEYPLIMSGQQWKKFKANFCEFITILIRQCQYSIMYDQYMMDAMIGLITGLTDSQVRAFRHTSTLAAMKFMTALVDVALNLSISHDHTQRQYEAERVKSKSKQASERLEILGTKLKEIEENQEEIKHMLQFIFKGVFVHRYRDIRPEIRVICLTEIGVWMRRFPSLFLDDSYLKYVGWTLYDKIGEVRLCCLRCLQPLYDMDELAPKLELFTNRFKDRIVEMILDKDLEVGVHAIKLLISIYKYKEDILQDKDCESVYELVYATHRGMAQAAGEFLCTKLFTRPPNLESENPPRVYKSKRGKKRSENTPFVRDLVQFFIESELHEHGAYIVDSLWEQSSMLKDWSCMTDLLLEEPGHDEEALDEKQESVLIELMTCSIKQAATGEYPVGRGPPSRKLSTKELKQAAEDRSRLTEHFITVLPQLLAKYSMETERVCNLLTIPMHFDLDIYTSGRHEKELDSLLHLVNNIVEKQGNKEVLLNCSKLMEYMVDEGKSISNKCALHLSAFFDQLVNRYNNAIQNCFQEGLEPDDDDHYVLLKSLERLGAFYSCHNLNNYHELWNSLFNGIVNEKIFIPKEILANAIGCCQLSLMWQVQSFDNDNVPDDILRITKKRVKTFMERCGLLLKHQELMVQEEAYISICDLLIIYGKKLGIMKKHLESLVYTPDNLMQNLLINFVREKVFIDEDDDSMDENKKIANLHKRRNLLAGFCKLIVYNVIKIKMAADMFKYYMKFYNDYGDIIKSTLSKAREINKVQTAKTLALSLTQLFKELQNKTGSDKLDTETDAFQSIKELSRRFMLSFGIDFVKIREAIAAIHKDGIHFVVNSPRDENTDVPVNIQFFYILTEFSFKLMKQDKKVVLQYLDVNLIAPSHITNDWTPYVTYRNSLMQGDGDSSSMMQPPPPPPQAPTTPVGKRGRSANKRKHILETHEDPSVRAPRSKSDPQKTYLHTDRVTRQMSGIKKSRLDSTSDDGVENDEEENKIEQFESDCESDLIIIDDFDDHSSENIDPLKFDLLSDIRKISVKELSDSVKRKFKGVVKLSHV